MTWVQLSVPNVNLPHVELSLLILMGAGFFTCAFFIFVFFLFSLMLVFISVKMILEYFHYAIGTGASLCVVVGLLALGAAASLLASKRKKHKTEDHAPNYDAGDFAPASPLRQREPFAYSAQDDLSRVLV